MKNEYYNAEITYLKKLLKNSDQPILQDPSVDRLIESIAYLNAQLTRHLDNDLADISETALQHLVPELLMPIPSCCLVEFQPKTNQLQKTITINNKTKLQSNSNCCFTLKDDCIVNPIRINEVDYAVINSATSKLTLKFSVDESVDIEMLKINSLKLYLNLDYFEGCELYYLFLRNVAAVYIDVNGKQSKLGGQEIISTDNLFINKRNQEISILNKIKTFFASKEQQFFIDIKMDRRETDFSLVFEFSDKLSDAVNLLNDSIKVNVAVIANEYEQAAEPIYVKDHKIEYPLIINLDHHHEVQFQNVQSVIAIDSNTMCETHYLPYGSYGNDSNRYQLVSREDSQGNLSYFLSFSGSIGLNPQVISCLLTVTNGRYPEYSLGPSTVFQGENVPASLKISPIKLPSHYSSVPQKKDFFWRILGYLTLQLSSLENIEVLRQLLHDLDWTKTEVNREKIDSILTIEINSTQTIQKGLIYPLCEIVLAVDDSKFNSISEVFVFGEMLYGLFLETVHLNTFVKLAIKCRSAKETLFWNSISGRKIRV